jgi:hypothetical protein
MFPLLAFNHDFPCGTHGKGERKEGGEEGEGRGGLRRPSEI